MFKIGDYAFDKKSGESVQMVDVNTVWEFISYKVFTQLRA